MASVHSPIRKIVKPILLKCFGKAAYEYFQVKAKWRDIEMKLVEEPEMAILPKILGPEDNSVDVGANFAYYTVRLSRLSPKGKVIAFEPIPSTFRIAQKLVKKSGAKNIQLENLGVGEKTEVKTFELPLQEVGTPSAGQAHIHGRDNSLPGGEEIYSFKRTELVDCKIVKLDEFLQLPSLKFIKIDIEGAELFALRGMNSLIEKFRPVILLEICDYFLKGYGLANSDLMKEFAKLRLSLYELSPGSSEKLTPVIGEPKVNKNYFLLPTEKISTLGNIL